MACARHFPVNDPNGVGPAWAPAWLRRILTALSGLFFKDAGWREHDIGYGRGFPARHECDRKFLQAMLRDASETTTSARVFACCFLAWVFWIVTRLLGWTRYNYHPDPE